MRSARAIFLLVIQWAADAATSASTVQVGEQAGGVVLELALDGAAYRYTIQLEAAYPQTNQESRQLLVERLDELSRKFMAVDRRSAR